MSNPKQNPKTTVPALNTLPEFYKHYYNVVLDKMEPEAKANLQKNLLKPNRIVRGEPVEYPDVRHFIKKVIEVAETEYNKAIDKKVINEITPNSKTIPPK